MKLSDGLKKIVKENEPLAGYTWFRIGGPARYLFEPTNVEELYDLVTCCREENVTMYVLGAGSNLLVPDAGVDGAVIRLAGEFNNISFTDDGVQAGAAYNMSSLVLKALEEGRSGIEAMTGIPGSIGGCVRINAGGSFGDIGSAVKEVTVMNEDGEVFQRHRDDLAFAYRSSNIVSKFILGAYFLLTEEDPQSILKQLKKIWINKKNSQPLGRRNSGCVFKNPRGMSAGALIDKAGLKGKRIGGAQVSEKHANFIVVDEGATAFDVLKLIDFVRDTVAREFSVNLEKEVEVW